MYSVQYMELLRRHHFVSIVIHFPLLYIIILLELCNTINYQLLSLHEDNKPLLEVVRKKTKIISISTTQRRAGTLLPICAFESRKTGEGGIFPSRSPHRLENHNSGFSLAGIRSGQSGEHRYQAKKTLRRSPNGWYHISIREQDHQSCGFFWSMMGELVGNLNMLKKH